MNHTIPHILPEQEVVTEITIRGGLTEIPASIFLHTKTLKKLDLSGNKLNNLPNNFSAFEQLEILFLSDNLFTEFPSILKKCPRLSIIGFKNNFIRHFAEGAIPFTTRWLILTNNQLTALPNDIGNCIYLEKLALAGNKLSSIPDSMQHCTKLGLIRLSANLLTALPEWILQLPKLAWLAYAGNPFCTTPTHLPNLPIIPWEQLAIGQELGKGASGIIYKAEWTAQGREAVAVKVFKGEVTSDGYPTDELNACLLAGNHPNLVQIMGRINNHPTENDGIVMKLIPANFSNVGLPPSLDSCTRDTFLPNTYYTLQQVCMVLKSVANAAAYLHSKGILHGDLYAHNTLMDAEGNTIFGDFGAATIYESTDNILVEQLEKIEVRSFGNMVDDLLGCVKMEDKESSVFLALQLLCTACTNDEILARPNFGEIVERLK